MYQIAWKKSLIVDWKLGFLWVFFCPETTQTRVFNKFQIFQYHGSGSVFICAPENYFVINFNKKSRFFRVEG
jgi:hypothetical protein